MIDLHLHTTASDGTLSPAVLVERAHQTGIRALSVTDHDTMAAVPEATEVAAAHGLEFIPGIEITAVLARRDVHLLAYFLDPVPPGLASFLHEQREDRSRRVREMVARLVRLGMPIELEVMIDEADAAGHAVGRPAIARALVEAGHVTSEQEAFDRWLADGRPAYVPRRGVPPAEVIRIVSRAGGVSALAHPGLLGRDDVVPGLAKSGLSAIEAFHGGHDAAAQSHYARLARQYGLAGCGGSDFHGDHDYRARRFGAVGLPRGHFKELLRRISLAHSVAHRRAETS